MSTADLTVTIQDEGTVRVQRQDGFEVVGEVKLDPLDRNLISIFQDWLSQGKINERRELEAFGTILYKTLFSGKIGELLQQTLRGLHEGERLRIQLSFGQKTADLASLPWEYLYYPGTETEPGFFLANHTQLVLSRYVPLERPATLGANNSLLRVLIVRSQPQDLSPIIADPVLEAIQRLTEKYPIRIDILNQPTMDNLLDVLQETEPDVLHFIGHGRFDKMKQESQLALLGFDEQSVLWCDTKTLAEYFIQMHSPPRVVLLQFQDSTIDDFTSSFNILANQLIRAKIQAVVAIPYQVTVQSAAAFSQTFFTELVSGKPIDAAVQAGRTRIYTATTEAYSNSTVSMPVLYMARPSEDGFKLRGTNL